MTNTELYSATSSTLGTTAGADLVALAADLDVSYVYEVLAGLNSALTGDAADVAATIAASYGEAADSDLATWTEGFLNDGYTAAQILEAYDAFLLSTDNAEAVATLGLDDAKSTLENKNAVSEYYSETLGLDFVSIEAGQAQLADVDATEESVTAANLLVDAAVPVDTTLLDAAAQAAYALLITTETSGTAAYIALELAVATTAEAAIAAGNTQVEIDAAYDVIVAANAASITLSNIEVLANANDAIVDYLAAVDVTVIDPTTIDDDADSDVLTDDTVVAATDVVQAATDVVTDYTGIVATYLTTQSDAVVLAEYNAAVSAAEGAVAIDEAELADAETAAAAVDGLVAAGATLDTATAAGVTAAATAATAASAYVGALAAFVDLNAVTSSNTVFGDTDLTDDVLAVGGTTLIEFDATTEAYIISDDVATSAPFTETDYEGITALLNSINAQMAADAAVVTADAATAAANAAVQIIDPSAVITHATTGTLTLVTEGMTATTPVSATAATQAEITAETTALTTAVTTADSAADAAAEAANTGDTVIIGTTGIIELSGSASTAFSTVTAGQHTIAAGGTTFDGNATGTPIADLITALNAADDFADLVVDYQAALETLTNVSPLLVAVSDAEDAIDDGAATPAGSQIDLDALLDAKVALDAVLAIDADLTDLQDAQVDAAASVDEVNLANGANGMSTDTVAFISNLVAGDAATVSDFDATTDYIYFGTDYTVNTGALTTGDNAALEMFIIDNTAGTDAVVTFETAAFGSASASDFFTITLTGVTAAEVAVVDGMIVGA